MRLNARLVELSKIAPAPIPVVTLYLDTRWTDEQQRQRARVFVKHHVTQARRDARAGEMKSDLDWVEAEATALVDQARFPEARGAAFFACGPLGLREVLPLRSSTTDTFTIADRPHLRPLVDALDQSPGMLVAWVDTERARLIRVSAEGAAEELALASEVTGHHRRGGWALLAQSHYQRHIETQKGRHLDAGAETLVAMALEAEVERIVLAGEAEPVAALRERLPAATAGKVAGIIRAGQYEAAAALVDRAFELTSRVRREEQHADVDAVFTDAAKGGRAVTGLAPTLEAVSRGAVRRLYVLESLHDVGVACRGCGAIQAGFTKTCRCGEETVVVELGEAMIERVIASGSSVDIVADHSGLAAAGGVAARLRYPLAHRS